MMDLTYTGLDEAIAHLERMRAGADAALQHTLYRHADEARVHLAGASPVDTGAMAGGWYVDALAGPLQVDVVNPVRSPAGFPYPSAQITGTGQRGASATPTSGYVSGFSTTPGMVPATGVHEAWNEESSRPLYDAQFMAELMA